MMADLATAIARLEAGKWDEAHGIVQDMTGPDAAWVHAYLHRIEGDLPNARYWYGRAGRTPYDGPLATELADLKAAFS